jgi:hypothetical protein
MKKREKGMLLQLTNRVKKKEGERERAREKREKKTKVIYILT